MGEGTKDDSSFAKSIPQIYGTLIGKAPGVVVYWLPKIYKNQNSEGLPVILDGWPAMVQAGMEVRKLMPLLLAPGEELPVPSDPKQISARARLTQDGKLIVLLANLQDNNNGSTASWNWRLPKGDWSSRRTISGSGQWKVKDNLLEVTLSPLECLTLKFQPSQPND
jgi:hypothetical protein